MATRVCSVFECPNIYPKSFGPRCPDHAKAHERERGTKRARGYDADYYRERRTWVPKVAAGVVKCARCGEYIHSGEPWHLDHSDDRTSILGPSHVRCNLSAAGRASHK